MIRVLFLLLAGYCAYLILRSVFRKSVPPGPARETRGEIAHRDPVCGIYVTEDDAVVGRLGDRKIYFCSRECLEKYRENINNRTPPP